MTIIAEQEEMQDFLKEIGIVPTSSPSKIVTDFQTKMVTRRNEGKIYYSLTADSSNTTE
jgi:hypothetical protein